MVGHWWPWCCHVSHEGAEPLLRLNVSIEQKVNFNCICMVGDRWLSPRLKNMTLKLSIGLVKSIVIHILCLTTSVVASLQGHMPLVW